MNYRADIDGLRAVAVLSVILFHAGFSSLGGGYVGVDIFFVISGYVIAQSILADIADQKFSILRFYAKRIRRIFPALIFTALLTTIMADFVLPPEYYLNFSKSLSAVSLFISNLFFWKDSGYFSADALSKPLLHTWSLSVEEQYYILSPIYTYLVYKYFPQRVFVAFLWVLLASLALSLYATSNAPTANFFLPVTRAWELLIGAMLAQTPPRPLPKKWMAETIAAIGMALLIIPMFLYDEFTPFPGAAAIPPCLGAALLIYSGTGHTTLIARALSLKPCNLIGKMSYSLYLVHWPVIVAFYYLTLSRPDISQTSAILLITFALAFISWRFVETPFRHISLSHHQNKLLAGGLATIALLLSIGQIGTFYKGFPDRFSDYTHVDIPGNAHWNKGKCFLENDAPPTLWQKDSCALTSTPHGKKVLLWGDSFAAQYVPGIVANKDKFDYELTQYTSAGCPPVLSYYSYARPNCTTFNANAIAMIEHKQFDAVILSARWTDLKKRGVEELRSTLDALEKLGVPVIVMGQSPEFSVDVQLIKYHQSHTADDHPNAWAVFFDPEINTEIQQISKSAGFINPMDALCQESTCPYYNEGYLFEDYGHFSVEGSTDAVRTYFPMTFRAFTNKP